MPVRPRLVSRVVVGLFVAALLLPATARAQFDTATVLGTIKDSSGGVAPGAPGTLKNPAPGISATAVTAADGNSQFLNVRMGTSPVRAELQGFSVAEAKEVEATVGARQ